MNGPGRRREPRGPERTYRKRGARRDAYLKPAYSQSPVGAPMPRSAHCGPFDGGKFGEPRAVPPELASETLPRLGARCVRTAHHATFGCASLCRGSLTKSDKRDGNCPETCKTYKLHGEADMTGDHCTPTAAIPAPAPWAIRFRGGLSQCRRWSWRSGCRPPSRSCTSRLSRRCSARRACRCSPGSWTRRTKPRCSCPLNSGLR
jgi:hypothetical protein